MGVSSDGSKRVSGVRDGASENSTVVVDLLDSLEERGLVLTSRALFVLDGGRALRKAGDAKYGELALVQRCHLHQLRNGLAYLPPIERAEALRRRLVAWGMERHGDAEATQRWLRSRRVQRWRDATMALRWPGTGLVKAQPQFKRRKGHRQMGALVAALESDPVHSTKVVA